MQSASNFQPGMPFYQFGQCRYAVKVFKNVVQTNFINGVMRKIQFDYINVHIGNDIHNVVLTGRIVDIHIAIQILFTAPQVQTKRFSVMPEICSLKFGQN